MAITRRDMIKLGVSFGSGTIAFKNDELAYVEAKVLSLALAFAMSFAAFAPTMVKAVGWKQPEPFGKRTRKFACFLRPPAQIT